MITNTTALCLILCGIPAVSCLAQTMPGPDVLILIDGEKLIGHLKSASGPKLVFASDLAGEVTIPWSKVQELHSAEKFAAVPNNVTLRNSADAASVAQGTLDMKDQKLEVTAAPGAPRTIPVETLANVVPEKSFDRAFHRQSLFEGWHGAAGFGLAITRSTTDSRTVNGYVGITRKDPSENWLTARNMTSLDFNYFSGTVSSSGVLSSKFALFQSNAVREFYLSPKRFLFAGANWEHNSAQGLDLMQGYGGGFGVVFLKTENSEWTGRAGLGYVHQGFQDPTLNKNIIGSRFNQTYSHKFARGITFSETGGFRPAWNHTNAYVTGFIASLSVPMYRQFNLSLNSFDSYINDPPPYFKKNTLQVTLGVNYTLK